MPGPGDCGILSLEKVATKLRHAGSSGRFDDGGVRHGDVAGAIDHHQRNARAGDERVQLRVPRRDADGESGVGMAGSDVYGAGGAGRKRSPAGSCGSLLFAGTAASGSAVTRSPLSPQMHASKTYAVALSPDGCIWSEKPAPRSVLIPSAAASRAVISPWRNKSAEFVSVQAQVEVLHAVAHDPSRLEFDSRLGVTGRRLDLDSGEQCPMPG